MPRYIDADYLYDLLDGGYDLDFDEVPETKAELLRMITQVPTSDVVPVKHARWVLDEDPHDGDCRCSACLVCIDQMHERNHKLLNAITGNKWWTFYKYCPNCGAEMTEENDG